MKVKIHIHTLHTYIYTRMHTSQAVVVLINGGMVAVEQEKELAPAVLEAFYPGRVPRLSG